MVGARILEPELAEDRGHVLLDRSDADEQLLPDGGVGATLGHELQDAIDRIAEGGTVLDPEVVAQLIGRRHDPLATLTPRESEVLQLMAEGRTNAAIAEQLFIGTGAVEKNVTAIFGKLGLEDSGSDHRRVLAVIAWLQR